MKNRSTKTKKPFLVPSLSHWERVGEGLIIRTVLIFDRPYNLQSRISIQVQEFVVGPKLAVVFDPGTIVTRVGQRESSRYLESSLVSMS